MAIERLQAGAQSATYLIHVDSDPRALTINDWNALPPGKLRDVLVRAYPATETERTNDQIARAFAAAGGSVSAVSAGVSIGIPLNFSYDGPTNTPVLGIPNQELGGGMTVWDVIGIDPVVVQVSVSYSASE